MMNIKNNNIYYMYMPNRWIEFVKKWSSDNNVSYGCALTKPEMKEAYHKANPKKVKMPKRVAKLEESKPPTDVKSKMTFPNLKISPQKKKLIIEEDDDVDFLKSIDKKELKRIVLEWFGNRIKIRGKISPRTKEFLAQDAVKIFEDFVMLYERDKAGNPVSESEDLVRFNFVDEFFNPKNLVDFVKGKMAEESDLVVGQEYLINHGKDLAKVTKITPTLVTFKLDEKIEDNFYQGWNYMRTEGHYERKFKGKSQSVKKDKLTGDFNKPEPVPKNFNYKWRESSDMG